MSFRTKRNLSVFVHSRITRLNLKNIKVGVRLGSICGLDSVQCFLNFFFSVDP